LRAGVSSYLPSFEFPLLPVFSCRLSTADTHHAKGKG
jgi:hypothetical protein